jgi:hypothetical protein
MVLRRLKKQYAITLGKCHYLYSIVTKSGHLIGNRAVAFLGSLRLAYLQYLEKGFCCTVLG